MHIEQLLQELAEAGVYLAAQDGKLVCKAAEGALTEDRRRLIAVRKAEFMAFLQSGAAADEPALTARAATKAPLAPTQQQLWFIEQLTESGANYSIPVTYRLTGHLDVDALEKALCRVIERHHSLRSCVAVEEGKPVAVVCDTVELHLVPQSLEHLDAEDRVTEIRKRLQQAVATPFDLMHETPLRAQLFRLAPDEHVLMLTLHHIAGDGWSVENLLRELSALYAAFVAGEPDPLPPLALQYSDYAIWQREWLQGERLERELGFWRRQLDGAPLVHGLPLDRPRPSDAITAGATLRRSLPAGLYQSVLDTARDSGVTAFMFLEAAFAVLVARWSGETDIVIGTPIANRPRNELAPLIGFFANTLAFRTQLDGNPRFSDVLEQTRAVALDAFAHQHLPFELLVEDLNPPRSMSLPPLAQIMFSLQDMDEDAAFDLPGVESRALVPELSNAKFDLNLNLNRTLDGLEAGWDYCSDLFRADTIARMADAFEVLLAGIVSDPGQRIQHLPLLAANVKEPVASAGPRKALPSVAGVHVLFEKQAAENPQATAVVEEKTSLSYGDLNRRANRIAHALMARGVTPDDRVAIHAERSVDMVAAMLGVMKAGGAYVPLDPAHPAERLEAMLTDSGAAILLTQKSLKDTLANASLCVMLLDDAATFADCNTHNPDLAVTPSHLAYVLYTSGSTGTPKGVMVEHGNLLNLIEDAGHRFADSVAPVASVWASFGFDASVFEVFPQLARGGALHIVPEAIRADVDAFLNWLIERRVTHAYLPPFFVRALAERPHAQIAGLALRRVMVGAESLPENELHRLHAVLPELRIVNCYGPTEATVYGTAYADIRDRARNAPIGTAIDNTSIHLLDEAMQPVPRGVAGEICIAGASVARGYLNRPDLTAECFIHAAGGERMYRTGDLGRWLPEGQLEFRGRKDQQIKLNGVRIEPGEIEAALVAHPDVNEAAVVVREDQGMQRRLVAYLVSRSGETISADDLREHLAQRLPAYMLPAAYMTLDALPLTISGKLNARALPAPGMDAYTTAEHVAPETSLEKELAAIWQELLQHESVGVTAGFFDLGGHSLLLTRLQNRLAVKYEIELALKDLFAARTIREQAALIESLRNSPAVSALPPLQPRPADAAPVLSYAQSRLWFIDQMGNAGAVYNIPAALHLEGELRPALLRDALQAIVERHEVLRTQLVSVNGEARPRKRSEFELALPFMDLRELGDAAREQALRAEQEAEAVRPFDLGRDLFLRARLLWLAEREHVLLLTLHHVASDGWSMGALLGELAELYEAGLHARASTLPALTLQYADYAHWQQQWLAGERLETQWRYWQKQLDGVPALHNLPLDHPRPGIQRYNGAVYWQHLPRALLEKLQQLARRHDTTLFITLQAAFAVLLARWSGDTDIVMGTPIANRRHEALAPLIGFFVNTLVLRSDLSDNPRFEDALAAAKATALDAYQHQDLPFEMLVDRLRPQRSLSHSPLFQVMLALENGDAGIPSFGGLKVSDVATESRFAKFDLTLNLSETSRGLHACWDYCSDLFRADTIARLADSFATLLDGIVADPASRIQQLPLAEGDMTIVNDANDTDLVLPDVAGVHQLFESRAAATPDVLAVCDGNGAVSYAELNRRANRVAHALRAKGVVPDVRVGIYLERGVGMIVGLLGILKAGGAYVPLDPAHPAERLTSMLADSGAIVLVTRKGLLHALPEAHVPRLLLDDEAALEDFDDSNPAVPELNREKLAIVLYTSGSTGTPKGVMLEHVNLLNLIVDGHDHFRDNEHIVASQWTSFGFDISAFEVFVTLTQGGTLHIVPEEIRTDSDAFLDWLCELRITQACLPPFFVRGLRECPDARIAALSLRRIMVGVEPLVESELYRLRTLLPGLYIFNSYGPTETTVYSTGYNDVRDLDRRTPIGWPSANTRIHILDDAGQPVPVGVVGEIHIAGLGVARGYLNRPDLTAKRFSRDAGGNRMYRTGDLGRWLPEGQIMFHGRRDHQLKLNGVRIEPGEIEAAVKTHPDVKQAVVVVRRDEATDGRQLIVYLVSRDGGRVSAESLRAHVAPRLSAYMLPAAYVTLDELPLTVSGKLDPRRLPEPDMAAYTTTGHQPAQTPLEHQLVAVWQDLLGHERVGVTTSFFDLGGNSLNAVKLMSAIRKATGKALPISTLFQAPTIRGLAATIEDHTDGKERSFAVLREGGEQDPLFVFHAAGGDVLCYQPMLKYLDSDIPVYGFLRSESADQRVPALKSIEELAAEYVVQMRRQQPAGSYRVAGWSSGGLLALEVAAQLERHGFEVSVVALIDTMLPTGTEVRAEHHAAGLSSLQVLPAADACRVMREFDSELVAAEPRNGVLDIPAADYFNYLVAANQIGLDFYRPDFMLNAAVHYFGCGQNRVLHTAAERIAQIQSLVRQTIVSREFDATHFSIMEEPDVAAFGRALNEALAVEPSGMRAAVAG